MLNKHLALVRGFPHTQHFLLMDQRLFSAEGEKCDNLATFLRFRVIDNTTDKTNGNNNMS